MNDLTGTGSIVLGASTLGYRHDRLEVALDEIAASGFDLVDIAMYPRYCPHFNALTATESEIACLEERLAARSLDVAVLNAADGLLGVTNSREQALDYARAALRLARRLGASGVTMQSGPEAKSPEDWVETARLVAPDLRALGAYADSLGLILTVELHKQRLMSNARQALDLMALVDHPAVGVALDPSHASYAGERISDVARTLGSHVKHVHLRDAIGKNILVVPGDGEVDFTEFARALLEIGYQGPAVIELEYEEAHAPQVTPDLKRARVFLEAAMRVA